MNQKQAEEIAVAVLAWMSRDDEVLSHFLGHTGAAAQDLRQSAQDPGFLLVLLDFLLSDEPLLLRFCDDHDLGYDQILAAKQALPGGADIHWT